MDYKLTFEDGSSAYLAHYGVKGMKWGVWNAETRAKRLGKNISGQGVSSKLIDDYINKTQKATNMQNAAYSSGPFKRIKNRRAKRAVKKADVALDKLSDAYMKRSSDWDYSKSDRDYMFKKAFRDFTGDKDLVDLATAKKFYANDIMETENNYQISRARKVGKDAVKRYLKYGTTVDETPRSEVDYAARQGVVVKNETEAKQFKQAQKKWFDSNAKINAYTIKHPSASSSTDKTYAKLAEESNRDWDIFMKARRMNL